MPPISTDLIDSAEELLSHKEAWDDLWTRSSVTNPTALAEPLALWLRRFAPDVPFRALVVRRDERWVAALPLIERRTVKVFPTGANPSNAWGFSGQFLVDEMRPENVPDHLDALVSGFRKLPFSLLWLDYIRSESSEWIAFREALARARISSQWHTRYSTAVFSLDGSYETLKSTWGKKSVAKLEKILNKHYVPIGYSFEILGNTSDILASLPACFELETRTWKGADGGTMLQQETAEYYTNLARFLSERDMMKLVLLRLKGELIAFKYCFQGKDTVFSQKTSYDPNYRDLSPGQVLQLLINRRFCDDPEIRCYDFIGEAGPHQMIWNSEPRINSQVVLPLSATGRAFFFLYDTIMPGIRRWRKKKET